MQIHRRKFNTFGISAGMLVFGQAHAFDFADLGAVDASKGLKLALEKGAASAIKVLGVQNGFMSNEKVKIGLPEPLSKGIKLLKTFGMGKQVDELVLQMNKAAETAVPLAQQMLTRTIQNMSVEDAKGILKGGDTSVTQFFVDKTREALTLEFMPTVSQVLGNLGVVERYNALTGKLAGMGMVSKNKAQLEGYVTGKTLDGLYLMIGEEEKRIRLNPSKAGSDLISKVFGTLR